MRTDPTVPKHKGITCLLVDMTLPGVEVRPLVTITGEKEFNEIFFTDVRVPVDATLGPVNEGWRVAMTTLAYERGTVAKLHLGTRSKVAATHRRSASARRWATAAAASDDPVLRQHVAPRLPRGRAAEAHLRARAVGRAARPGDGAGGQHRQALVERGRAAHHRGRVRGARSRRDSTGPWARDRVYSRALTIAGGTTQVNKNIVAQRILGLPRS